MLVTLYTPKNNLTGTVIDLFLQKPLYPHQKASRVYRR